MKISLPCFRVSSQPARNQYHIYEFKYLFFQNEENMYLYGVIVIDMVTQQEANLMSPSSVLISEFKYAILIIVLICFISLHCMYKQMLTVLC